MIFFKSKTQEEAYNFLLSQGLVGQINDMMFKHLRNQGYTGAMNDMLPMFESGPIVIPSTGLVALFDASDLSTLFQDSAGSAPVTAAGQSAGLWLDKSQGLALGPELLLSAPALGTGWIDNGGGSYTHTGASGNLDFSAVSFASGKYYKVAVEISAITNAGAIIPQFIGGSTVTVYNGSVSTAISQFIGLSSAGNNLLRIIAGTNAGFTIRGISVKEIIGYHARQITAALCSTYQTGPSRLIDDNIDDVLPVALTGTYSVYSAVSGALVYTEGVVMSGSYDILQNNLARCAIYDHALSAGERAQLAAYWGVTP